MPEASDASDAEGSNPPSPTLLPIPPLDVRWVHAGAQHFDLLPTPITALSPAFKAFSYDESTRIEDGWIDLDERQRKEAVEEWGSTEGEGAPARNKALKESKEKDKTADKEKKREKDEAKQKDIHASNLRAGEVQDRLEGKLPETEEVMSGQEQNKDEGGDAHDRKYKEIIHNLQKSQDLETIHGVPVSQDSMFEVSLETLSLHPVFWAHSGPRVPIIRGTWFLGDETRPCSWELAEELEKAYNEIRPWQPSYKDELATAIATGKGAEEKLRTKLPLKFGQGLGVIFDDAESGRLTDAGSSYISRAFWSSIRGKSNTQVYRGFAAARVATGKAIDEITGKGSTSHSRRGSSSSNRSVGEKEPSLRRKSIARGAQLAGTIVGEAIKGVSTAEKELLGAEKALHDFRASLKGKADKSPAGEQAVEEEFVPVVDSEVDDLPCTDLILVIHGIGQQLATTYESQSFVYAGNQLRQVLRKQSHDPALGSIMRDRRCQLLPVQWRASLDLTDTKSQEDKEHSMDNRFTMADITIAKSIPVVRELTNSVLLDIPMYMSQHREKMIEAVCSQANKLYRLWIARNPDFEANGGRVHIVGHSLGSALAANILSNQPTKMPALSQLPTCVRDETKNRFLFNTSNLFLCGSPLGIFLHLDQTQIMPRKGRDRTMNSPQDEALDRAGKFGCMAIDSLYNIFYFTDPVAYQLNATVDVRLALKRNPLAITSVTAGYLSSLTEGFGSISRYLPSLPALPAMPGFGSPTSAAKEAKPKRPHAIRLPSGIEMIGPTGEERLAGSRAERRFSALNPHGNIDFYLPSGGVGEYLEMITAHSNYWTDPSFGAFLLTEIFSTRLDLMRTGLGLAATAVPEDDVQ